MGAEFYGKTWKTGDVVGCMLDLLDRTISKISNTFTRPLYMQTLPIKIDFGQLKPCNLPILKIMYLNLHEFVILYTENCKHFADIYYTICFIENWNI